MPRNVSTLEGIVGKDDQVARSFNAKHAEMLEPKPQARREVSDYRQRSYRLQPLWPSLDCEVVAFYICPRAAGSAALSKAHRL
jgi:hypothetical protein